MRRQSRQLPEKERSNTSSETYVLAGIDNKTDIYQDFIKQLIAILHQAEDLESLEDLHALCSLMHTISMCLSWDQLTPVLLNDNGVFEYILQDDVFMGVVGMLECKRRPVASPDIQMIRSFPH